MTEHIDTLIIGGGQAGLAMSYCLTQQDRDHVVLEQAAQAGNVWRNQRWESFTLVTPNWTVRMPGAEYDGPNPDGFMPRAEVVTYFENYVSRFSLPVRYNVCVESVELNNSGYHVQTTSGEFRAANIVVATGLFQQPRIPAFAPELPRAITQLPSGEYRHPGSLPSGAVLVVGSAQSGCQIAEELYQSGRKVYLSTAGSSGRFPRRYRGKDSYNLKDNLARADKFAVDFLKGVDTYIEKVRLDAPQESLPELNDGYNAEVLTELDLNAAGIHTVIWAIGYVFNFSLVKLPVADSDGFPITQRGVTQYPGLYFLGMPWLHTPKSGLLLGVGDDAAYIASHIGAASQ